MHNEIEFNFPTTFGQAYFINGDGMEKMQVKPIVESIEKITTKQLEDIVRGWTLIIKKFLKRSKQKVST